MSNKGYNPLEECEESNMSNSPAPDMGVDTSNINQPAPEVTEEDLLNDLLSESEELVYNPEEFSRTNPPFAPSREKWAGLNLGKLVLVEVVKTVSPLQNDRGVINQYEYAGLEVAKLHIQIDSADGVLPKRSYHKNITIPVKTSNKGDIVTNKFYNEMLSKSYNLIMELFNAFTLESNLKLEGAIVSPITKDAFKLAPAYDTAKDRRVLKWNLSLELIAKAFNSNKVIGGVNQPIFQNKDHEGLPVWFTLIPDYANSYSTYAFPDRVGSGIIEVARLDKNNQILPALISIPTNISLTLIPKPVKKGKGETGVNQELDALSKNGLGGAPMVDTGLNF